MDVTSRLLLYGRIDLDALEKTAGVEKERFERQHLQKIISNYSNDSKA